MRWLKSLSMSLLTLSVSLATVATVAMPAAHALRVGNISEIEGDITCGRGTGGTMVYAETASFRVFICSDPNDPTQARFYRSFDRNGRPGLNLTATNYNPMQMRYFEFRNGGYTYVLQIPSAQIPNPVLAVEFPNGRRVEERITRYLTKSDTSNDSGICSFITGNHVNVRRSPSTRSQVLAQLNRGATVSAHRRTGSWVEIRSFQQGDRTVPINGWVSNQFINGCSEDQFDRWRR